MDNTIDRLKWLLERQQSAIAAADSKLTILTPLPVAMLGVSFAVNSSHVDEISVHSVPFIVASLLLFASMFFMFSALIPRLHGAGPSRIFFKGIHAKSLDDFRAEIVNESDEDFSSDLIEQIHVNAGIACRKYGALSKAMLFLAFASPIWIFGLLG